MKTKFVEYKKGEPRDCTRCCYYDRIRLDGLSCSKEGLFCTSGTRKDKKSGYFVEVADKNKPEKQSKRVISDPTDEMPIAQAVGKFMLIESTNCNDAFDHKTSELEGIFDTEKQAIDYMCKKVKESFDSDKQASIKDTQEWCSNYLIVEVKRAVKPVLRAEVTCEVKELK